MRLETWTNEDLRAGLAAIAELHKGVTPDLVKMVQWNEALHPRGPHGEFAVSGSGLGRAIIEGFVHAMHDGMTQRSRATHHKIFRALHDNPETKLHASHYWQVFKNHADAGQKIHPKDAYGKAIMAIHTGDLSYLNAGSAAPKIPSASATPKSKFVTIKKFETAPGYVNRIEAEGLTYIAGLTVGKSAIRNYTASWYSKINPALREGVLSVNQRHSVEQLDAALRETQTGENLVVYRRYGGGALQKILKAGVGGIFQDPGFHSTTTHTDVGRVRVEIPKGSPGLAIRSISHYSSEAEFLLPRESEFEIVKVGDHNEGDFTLRYIGSNKATHRPDVEASLTLTKEEVKPNPTYDASLSPAANQSMGQSPTISLPQAPKPASVTTPASAYYGSVAGISELSFVLGDAKKIDGPHGSQPGQWYQYADGTKVYAKPMSAERAMNEVGANQAYRVMGANSGQVPSLWIAKEGSQFYVVSQEVKDLHPFTGWPSPDTTATAARAEAAKLWAADAILSHWDVVGLNYDNLVRDSKGGVTRIDTGGAMRFRAQGSEKGEFWKAGGAWVEPWTMRGKLDPHGLGKINSQVKSVFGQISDTEAANALIELRNRLWAGTPSGSAIPLGIKKLESAWKSQGMSPADIAKNLSVIEWRLNLIPTIAEHLKAQAQAAS